MNVATERSHWRSVALPAEHGGWGLTLEPILLGLLLAWSGAGLLIGVAALLAFLVRTPLKLALVDLRRDRWLARTSFAARLATIELVAIGALGLAAVVMVGARWLEPVGLAAPLVAVQLWYDARSRGRRLVPELCGAVGMAAVSAAIVLAAGRSQALAEGSWAILAARSVGAIPFVRVQIQRLRRGTAERWHSDVAQVAAVAIGVGATLTELRLAAGLAGLLVLAVVQTAWTHQPPTAPKVLGLRQMALGFALVGLTALGAALL